MLHWIKKLLGGSGTSPSSEIAGQKEPPYLGEAWEAEQRKRRLAATHNPLDADYGRLEIAIEPSADYVEKRTKAPERRQGEERRTATQDRRKRDIPVKNDRRKNLWERRKQYGERRFRKERRDRDAPPAAPHKMPLLTTLEGLPIHNTAPAENTLSASTVIGSTPPPPPIESVLDTQPKTPLQTPSGTIVAYKVDSDSAEEYHLEMLCKAEQQVVLQMDAPGGIATLTCTEASWPLGFPCTMAEGTRLILTVRGNFTLSLNALSAGDIVLGAEKLSLNLSEIMQRTAPTTHLKLSDIGSDMEMLEPQTFRFGKTILHFDLTQTVEIDSPSGGNPVRISGPAGVHHFELLLQSLTPSN